MEKAISPEERIRRAEEIYKRRNYRTTTGENEIRIKTKRKYGFFRKIVIQIVICTLIYAGFVIVKKNNYIFSEETIKKAEDFLNYNISLQNIYDGIKNKFAQTGGEDNQEAIIKNQEQNEEQTEEQIEGQNIEPAKEQAESSEEKIEETLSVTEEIAEPQSVIEEASSIDQMGEDAKIAMTEVSFIVPLKGTITSRYGIRNPTTATVPKYHTGIDIAVSEGTVFVAAMEGVVEEVSSKGDYRKSRKNNKWFSYDFICTL